MPVIRCTQRPSKLKNSSRESAHRSAAPVRRIAPGRHEQRDVMILRRVRDAEVHHDPRRETAARQARCPSPESSPPRKSSASSGRCAAPPPSSSGAGQRPSAFVFEQQMSVAVPESVRRSSMRIPSAGIPDAMFRTCVVSLPMVLRRRALQQVRLENQSSFTAQKNVATVNRHPDERPRFAKSSGELLWGGSCSLLQRGRRTMRVPRGLKVSGMLNRYFGLAAHGTTVRTELLAGLTTFLTMAYIVVVNPVILGDAGMPVRRGGRRDVLRRGLRQHPDGPRVELSAGTRARHGVERLLHLHGGQGHGRALADGAGLRVHFWRRVPAVDALRRASAHHERGAAIAVFRGGRRSGLVHRLHRSGGCRRDRREARHDGRSRRPHDADRCVVASGIGGDRGSAGLARQGSDVARHPADGGDRLGHRAWRTSRRAATPWPTCRRRRSSSTYRRRSA